MIHPDRCGNDLVQEFGAGHAQELARIATMAFCPVRLLVLGAEPELRAEDAYEWTQGTVIFADRKRRDPTSSTITTADGQDFQPSAFWAIMRAHPCAVI